MENSEPLHSSRPRRQRQGLSPCRCLLYTVGVLGGALITIILVSSGYGAWQGWKGANDPHSPHRLDPKLKHNISDVNLVRALIDEKSRFDVAVSVWVTWPDSQQDESIRGLTFVQADQRGLERPKEQVLFSDIVLRDVSLHAKGLKTKVKYRLPLERFYDRNLTVWDLRSSMVLLPTNPSPLDHLVNYTQWKPDGVVTLPKLSHPFPYRADEDETEIHQNQETTLMSQLLNDWGASTSLLKFISGNETEPESSTITTIQGEMENDDAPRVELDMDEIDADEIDEATTLVDKQVSKQNEEKPKIRHPYVHTRTHFYAINETRPMERKIFNKLHKNLKSLSCGLALGTDVKPALSRCNKDYRSLGEWGLSVRYNASTSAGPKPRLGYLPFLGNLKSGAGPLDSQAIPVIQSSSGGSASLSEDNQRQAGLQDNAQTHIDIEWTVVFSGLSAGRMSLLEQFASPPDLAHNATDFERVFGHAQWEQTHGLLGHPSHDTRPWTRLFLRVLQGILEFPVHLLQIHYWYTRLTIVGINQTGVYLNAVANIWPLFRTFAALKPRGEQFEFWTNLCLSIVICAWYWIPLMLSLRLVSPILVVWRRGLPAGVTRVTPSHRERSFLRSDFKPPLVWLSGAIAILAVFAYAEDRWDWFILKPMLPKAADAMTGTKQFITTLSKYLGPLTWALSQSGAMTQLVTNHLHGTYASSYALATYLAAACRIIDILYLFPRIIGRHDANTGLVPSSAVTYLCIAIDFWQARTLPRVEQKQDEVDEDEE